MPAPPATAKKIAGLLSGAPKGGSLPLGLLGRPQGGLSGYTPTMREKMAGLLAKGWFGDTREGYRKAGKVLDVADMTPVGLLTGMYDAGRAGGRGDYAQAGLLGGLAALPLPGAIKKEAKKGIRAYHGSPHSFDKFSMDKIGTGEGAQAYGHGLYFAEGEGVAKSYRDALSTKPEWTLNDKPLHWVDSSILNDYKIGINGRTLDDGIKDAKEFGRTKHVEMLQDFKKQNLQRKQGSMYEVNIDADPDQFLDWDKPLSEQSEQVKAMLPPKSLQNAGTMPASEWWEKINVHPHFSKDTANDLRAKGIPGIKYLDAGSRAKGDGSRNYVVFDENLISIVRKYGIAGASAMLGYDVLENVTDEQAKALQQAERVY